MDRFDAIENVVSVEQCRLLFVLIIPLIIGV